MAPKTARKRVQAPLLVCFLLRGDRWRCTLKEQVIEVQRALIERLAEYEAEVGKLYETFAARLPAPEAGFFRELAQEQFRHARMAGKLKGLLEKGFLFRRLNGFQAGELEARCRDIRELAGTVRDAAPSAGEALTTALKVELQLEVWRFYGQVENDAPGFDLMADVMTRSAARHIGRIRNWADRREGTTLPPVPPAIGRFHTRMAVAV